MGIGIALASGLVRGFTQNIQEEKARRVSERAKLDEYQKMLLDAALTEEDYNAAAGKRLQAMLDSAKGRMNNQERINIFGQRGENIDMDFTDVMSQLNSADKTKEGMTKARIGTYEFLVPEEFDDQQGTPRADIIKFQGLYDHALQDQGQGILDHLAANPSEKQLFREQIPVLANSYLTQAAKVSPESGMAGVRVTLDSLPGYQFFNEMFKIDAFQQFKADIANLKTNVDFTTVFDVEDITEDRLYLPTKLLTGQQDDSFKYAPFYTQDFQTYTDNTDAAISALAEKRGEDKKFFFYNFVSDFEDKEELETAFSSIAELYKRGATSEFVDEEQAVELGNYLVNNERLKDDPILQAKILMPFVPPRVGKAERNMIAAGLRAEDFFSTKPFKDQFLNLYGEKLEDFQQRVDAIDRSKKNLRLLMEKAKQTTFPGGSTAESLVKVWTSIFGEFGTINQVLRAIGVSKEDEEAVGIINYLSGGSVGVDGDLSESTIIGQADTLRYILAADLARAEDSAGRLSDGDIQRNLNKLTGFGPGSKDREIAAIQTVIDTIDRQDRSIQVARQVASGRKITAVQRRAMDADRKARYYREKYFDSITDTSDNTPIRMTMEMVIKSNPNFRDTPTHSNVTVSGKRGNFHAVNGVTYFFEEGKDFGVRMNPAQVEDAIAQLSQEGSTPVSPASTSQSAVAIDAGPSDALPQDATPQSASVTSPAPASSNNIDAASQSDAARLENMPSSASSSQTQNIVDPSESSAAVDPLPANAVPGLRSDETGMIIPFNRRRAERLVLKDRKNGVNIYVSPKYPGIEFEEIKIRDSKNKERISYREVR